MTVSFWEFRSESVNAIHSIAADALASPDYRGHRTLTAAHLALDALALIEQICTESDLAYEDGNAIDEAKLERKLAQHYGEPRPISWLR